MSRQIIWTTQFKKDYKLATKRGLDIPLLDDCIRMLAAGKELASNSVTITFPDAGRVFVNVISNPIGF